MHHVVILFMYHLGCFFFTLTLPDAVCPWVFFIFFLCFFLSILSNLSILVRKTRTHRISTYTSTPAFDSERFCSEKHQENFEKLYIFRTMWAERKVILDELDLEIHRNFESQGLLPLLDISHPLPAILIREFYSNLSVHFTSSNIQFVKSWIRGEELDKG